MTSPSVKDIQNVWGRVLPDYVGSYTTKATSAHAPLDPAAASSLRIRVTTTINEITRLGTSGCCSNLALSITLSMLGDILDIVNIPDEFGLLADPRIIAGCVSLMTTVDVSPFHYDYGYVSFRILVLALNCCLLKHIGRLNHVMWRMKTMLVSLRLQMFWEESATMITGEVRGGAGLSDLFDSGTFNQYGLDRLLDLLHTSEKDFLVVMKSTKSIGLSGLMFVFSKQIEVERSKHTDPIHLFQQLMQPFSRILWRYLLAIPSFSSESEAILAIHNQIAPMVRLNDNNFIDLDDSRYVLLAFIGRLTETPPMMVGESAALMRFVEPLIVPGCEDLVPDMIQGTIEIMWDSAINQPAESDIVRFAIGSHLLHFRQIFIKLRPSYDHEQPWIEKVVDNILHGDLVDVIVRSMLTATEFNPDSANAETKLFSAAVETFAELSRLYTSSGIATRLQESGKLLDWFKYTDHFFDVGSFVEEFVDKYDFECINTICGQLIYGIMGALVGEHRMEFLRPIGGSCDNPRCPVPLGATLVCSQCEDLIYCTPWCLKTDWMGAWGGPHRRVCEAQSRKDPGLRFSYHSIIGVPSGFYEGVKRNGGSAPRLAEFVLRAVREQTGRPRL